MPAWPKLSLLSLIFTCAVSSQVDMRTISGLVRDASGAGGARTRVVIRNEGTGITQDVATNGAGLYVSTPLHPGVYVVEVEAAGFERAARRIELDISQRVGLDFDLVVGAVQQSVEVRDVGAVLQTETSTLSNLRTERAIKDLPLNSRNFAQLIGLAAGAMPAQSQ